MIIDTASREHEQTFAQFGIDDCLLETLARRGYQSPNKLQAQIIPEILNGKSIFCCAANYNGKGVGFALPIIQQVRRQPHAGVRAVILSANENCERVARDFGVLVHRTGVWIHTLGSHAQRTNPTVAPRDRPVILVGPPSDVEEALRQGTVDLTHAKHLFLDFAASLLTSVSSRKVLSIVDSLPAERQNVVFSPRSSPELLGFVSSHFGPVAQCCYADPRESFYLSRLTGRPTGDAAEIFPSSVDLSRSALFQKGAQVSLSPSNGTTTRHLDINQTQPDRTGPNANDHVELTDIAVSEGTHPSFATSDFITADPKKTEVTSTFESLGLSVLLQNELRKKNWLSPMEIQQIGVGPIKAGESVLLLAPPGRGKTGGFLLGLVDRLSTDSDGRRLLVLAPTAALAQQIAKEAHSFCNALGITVTLANGLSQGKSNPVPAAKASIIVATVEEILRLTDSGKFFPDEVSHVVIDEIDAILSSGLTASDNSEEAGDALLLTEYAELEGHQSVSMRAGGVRAVKGAFDDAQTLRDQLFELLPLLRPPHERQMVLVSATLPRNLEGDVAQLIPGGKIINASYETPLSSLTHYSYVVNKDQKIELLVELLRGQSAGTALVVLEPFDTQLHMVGLVADRITQARVKKEHADAPGRCWTAGSIHRALPPHHLQSMISKFRAGQFDVLVSDSQSLRGLDLDHVSHVYMYDLPPGPVQYRQTAGRAGRGTDRLGTVVTFVPPSQEYHAKVMYLALSLHPSWRRPQPSLAPQAVSPASNTHSDSRLSPEQMVEIVESIFDLHFDRPDLIITSCAYNRYQSDARESRQHLNLVGRAVYDLALWEHLCRNEANLTALQQRTIVKYFSTADAVDRSARRAGLSRVSAPDIAEDRRFGTYYTNAAQALFNFCGTLLLDGRSPSDVARSLSKFVPQELAREALFSCESVWTPNANLGEPPSLDERLALEAEIGHKFASEEHLSEIVSCLRPVVGKAYLPAHPLVAGRLVLTLTLTELVRRSAAPDMPVAELRAARNDLNSPDRIIATQLGDLLLNLVINRIGLTGDYEDPSKIAARNARIIETFTGAVYLDSGLAAAQQFVIRMYPELAVDAEQADQEALPMANLERLQQLLDDEGERLRRRTRRNSNGPASDLHGDLSVSS